MGKAASQSLRSHKLWVLVQGFVLSKCVQRGRYMNQLLFPGQASCVSSEPHLIGLSDAQLLY